MFLLRRFRLPRHQHLPLLRQLSTTVSVSNEHPPHPGAPFFAPLPPCDFTPRTSFPVTRVLNSAFLGHHRAALTNMQHLLTSTHLILELRDARVPLSSHNPLFESHLAGRPRIVVYTKLDLVSDSWAESSSKTPAEDTSWCENLRSWHGNDPVFFVSPKPASVEGDKTLFTIKRVKAQLDSIIETTQQFARESDELTGMRILIAGMPNVGKSTLINALRTHGPLQQSIKHLQTGGQPGVTRAVREPCLLSKDPLVYVRDTPGVFIPYLPNAETMIKLCLVGIVKDSAIGMEVLADYLLYFLNAHDPRVYGDLVKDETGEWMPTNNVEEFLRAVARRTGKIGKGARPNLEEAARWVVLRYREGRLGRWCLDDCEEGMKGRREDVVGWGESRSAARRRVVDERKQKGRTKKVKGGKEGV